MIDEPGRGSPPRAAVSPSLVEGARSLLFVSGADEAGLRRALDAEADAVVADLEDLVAPHLKVEARETVRRVFADRPRRALRLVRVNAAERDLEADLEALEGVAVQALMVPKASPELLADVRVSGRPMIALVETADGVRLAYELASQDGVARLAIGIGDLSRDLGLAHHADLEALRYVRSKLVVDSAAAGAAAPIDVPSTEVGDHLEREARHSLALGLGGKICLTTEQVAIVNQVYAR